MANTEYAKKMYPYAVRASKETGIQVPIILAQWIHETANGTSRLAKQANNHGGIKYSKYGYTAGQDGAFAKYSTLDQFTKDYVRVMNLPYYSKVRQAKTVEEQARQLGLSPYAESGYREAGGQPGASILARIKQYGLYGLADQIPTGSSGDKIDLSKAEQLVGKMSDADLKTVAVAAVAIGLTISFLQD